MLTCDGSEMVTPAPSVTSPVTVKLFEIFVGSCNTIKFVAASNCKSPAVLSSVFPLNLKLPVSTLEPFIKVVLDPSVKVAPLVRSIFKALALKLTVPLSCSTWNKSPTLKSPL